MEPDQENPQTQLLLHHHHQNSDHHQVETHVGIGFNGSSTSSGKSGSSSYMCRQSSAEQIQRISARLRQYGKNIEGKNVFYWSQNHKARERQKKIFTVDTNHLHPMLLTPPQPMQLQIGGGGGGFGWKPTHEQQQQHHQMNIHTSTTKYMTTANISSGVSCPSSPYCSSDGVVLGTTTVGQIDCNGYGFVLMEKSFKETLNKSFQLLVFLGEHTTNCSTPGITTPPYSNRSGGHGQSSGTQTQWTSNLQTQSTLQAQYNYPAQGSHNTVQPFNVIYAQPQPQYTIVPQYTKEAHLTYALQWGRGTMSYFYGDINSINSVPKKFSNHGLYGNDIPVRPFKVLDFDPTFDGDRELLFQLLHHWRNVRKNRLPEEQPDRNQAHQIEFWRGIYNRHAGEVYMTQYEYFTYTMGLYHSLDNIVNHAVMEFCGPNLDDIGRRELNVPLFLARVHQKVKEYPTIHVSDNRGFQEIRELKFYLSYKTGIYIALPQHRQVTGLPDYTPNHLGVAPYNPQLPLFVT